MKKKQKAVSDEPDRSFLSIDLGRLEWECARQSALFEKYARRAVRARRKLDDAKVELDLIEAELDKDIRDTPDKFGLDKFTEKACASAIVRDTLYQRAIRLVNDLKEKVGINEVAASALDHKKKMLEKEVDLHGQGYFSEPKVKRDDMKESVDNQKKKLARSRQ